MKHIKRAERTSKKMRKISSEHLKVIVLGSVSYWWAGKRREKKTEKRGWNVASLPYSKSLCVRSPLKSSLAFVFPS